MSRDEYGYGLTLSGDQPVFVQTVRQGGAADRAGVRENDVIVKVNGQNVTEASHSDVVELIQGRTNDHSGLRFTHLLISGVRFTHLHQVQFQFDQIISSLFGNLLK